MTENELQIAKDEALIFVRQKAESMLRGRMQFHDVTPVTTKVFSDIASLCSPDCDDDGWTGLHLYRYIEKHLKENHQAIINEEE